MPNKFKGYLLKVGSTIFPNDYISLESWGSKPDQRTDEDSYTDGNGELVRNILPHTRTSITFETIDGLHLDEKIEVQSFINRNNTTCEYWNDEINDYKQGKFYVADPEFPIKNVTDNDIIYGKIKFEIIEY